MEVAIRREALREQLGPDDAALVLDQAAIRLVREQRLPDPDQCKRIREPQQQREQQGHRDGGAEGGENVVVHGWSLRWRWAGGRSARTPRCGLDPERGLTGVR